MTIIEACDKLWEEIKHHSDIVGIGLSGESITIYLLKESKGALDLIPKSKGGYKVVSKVSGEFKTLLK